MPGGVQRLQVLGGVRRRTGRSRARARRRCAAPARADRAARAGVGWRTPCPSARSPRTARPFASGLHSLLFNRSLDSLSTAHPRTGGRHVLPPAAQRRDRLRLLPVRLQEPRRRSRSSIRTSISSTSTSRSPRPRAPRSSRCSRRTCRPTTSPGCPSWSSAPARPPTCPRAPASSSTHHALADGEVVELGNTELRGDRDARPRAAHHAYLVTDHTRGDEPWFVLTGDALLVGDAGRPDLHAHGEHTVEDMARTLYRSLTERLLTLPDHLAALPRALLGLGLRARPVGQPGLDDRLRAPPQPRRCSSASEDAFVAGAARRHPAGARAAGRDRRRQPRRPAARRGA